MANCSLCTVCMTKCLVLSQTKIFMSHSLNVLNTYAFCCLKVTSYLVSQALIHGLNRHYYSITINYRKNELEQKVGRQILIIQF